MLLSLVAPRCLHTHRVLVIVILVSRTWVSTATIQSPHGIRFKDMVEWIKEHDSICGDSNRSHWQRLVFVLGRHRNVIFVNGGHQRQLPNVRLFFDVRRISIQHSPTVWKGGSGMIRKIATVNHKMFLGHRDHNSIRTVLVLFNGFVIQV